MNLPEQIRLMREIDIANDELAKGMAAEFLLLELVPEEGKIGVQDLIDKVISVSKEVAKTIPTFDFARWCNQTMLEVIDFLICSEALDGPMVMDFDEDSHKLLSAEVSRGPWAAEFLNAIERELFEYRELARLAG